MRCPHCGMEINEMDKFCKNCGNTLDQENINSSEEPIILEPEPHEIPQQPKNIPELLKKARTLESEKNLIEAKEICLEILVRLSNADNVITETDHLAECRKILTSIKQQQAKDDFERAKQLLMKDDFQEVIDICNRLKQDDPENDDLKQLSYEAMEGIHRKKRAEEEGKIRELKKNRSQKVNELLQEADFLHRDGKIAHALNLLKEALKVDSESKLVKERIPFLMNELKELKRKKIMKFSLIAGIVIVLGAIFFGLTFLMELPPNNELWFFGSLGCMLIGIIIFFIGLFLASLSGSK